VYRKKSFKNRKRTLDSINQEDTIQTSKKKKTKRNIRANNQDKELSKRIKTKRKELIGGMNYE